MIYTTILDAEKPACFRCDSGKEKTTNGVTYFHVECRLLDFNGQVFGEVSTALGIRTFQGAKRVDMLDAFPLEFHRHQKKMKEYFVRCGRQFVSLMGQHHVQYRGNAFYVEKGEYVEVPVESRIMVDVAYFRKINPNYMRPRVNELARPNSVCGLFYLDTEAEEVKSNGLDKTTMSEDNLMICSQTVYGWSFGNKRWCKPCPLNTLRDGGRANMMQSGICGGRHQGHCLESVFFRQSRDSRREEEGDHCSREGSYVPGIERYDRRLCEGKGPRFDNTSAVRNPALSSLP
jgi:hypothetical protein